MEHKGQRSTAGRRGIRLTLLLTHCEALKDLRDSLYFTMHNCDLVCDMLIPGPGIWLVGPEIGKSKGPYGQILHHPSISLSSFLLLALFSF